MADQKAITDECKGCNKIIKIGSTYFEKNTCKMVGMTEVCQVYLDPAAVQNRMGRTDACAINFVATLKKGEKVRVGQQKQKRNR